MTKRAAQVKLSKGQMFQHYIHSSAAASFCVCVVVVRLSNKIEQLLCLTKLIIKNSLISKNFASAVKARVILGRGADSTRHLVVVTQRTCSPGII